MTDTPKTDSLPRLVQLCLKRGDKPYELLGDACGDETCDQCGQSIWATDFEENHRAGYKSDRNQNANPHPDAVVLKTLCRGCLSPMVCHWSPMMDFAGKFIPAADYMAKTLLDEDMGVFCDPCLEKMPDVKLEDLIAEEST